MLVTQFIRELKNNEVMHIARLNAFFLDEWNRLTNDAQNYLLIPHILIGTRDVRARYGTFTDPWQSTCPEPWKGPSLKFTKDSINDLMDARAIEIIKQAKNTSRNITIMWSGGIDSTAVLVSLLKNINPSDLEMLTICLNSHSILDNPNFYFKHLSSYKNIKFLNSTDLSFITNDFLDKNILVHGDPGDGIFGPSTAMYQYFSNNGLHLEPWKKHIKTIEDLFEPKIERDMFVKPGLGKWFTNIVTRTLEDSGYSDHVSSVADWYWWTYFNFKWAGLCTFPLHNGIIEPDHGGITDRNYNFYASTVFYNAPQFQHWAYSNLKEMIGHNVFKTHKLKAREYIYDFDKDFQYFSRKRKTGAPPPNNKNQKSNLIGHSRNFVPILGGPSQGNYDARKILLTILSKYTLKF